MEASDALNALPFFNCRAQSSSITITYLRYDCQNDSTYNPNSSSSGDSIYRTNLNLLLSTLSSSSNTSLNGFNNFTAGGRDPSNTVYGLFMCRGDVNTDVCAQCVATAGSEIINRCPDQKIAIILYDECLLRYSNQSIFSRVDQSFRYTLWNTKTATDPDNFNNILGNTMAEIAGRAAINDRSGKKFSVKEVDYPPFQRKLYALAQCTPDISSAECVTCLRNAIAYIPTCCANTLGGRVIYPSCNIRYELYNFYNSVAPAPAPAPAPIPVPPIPTIPPLPLSTPVTTSKEDRQIPARKIIAIVVAILVASLLFIAAFYFARKARKRYNIIVVETTGHETEILTEESLQYNLSEIQTATNNFALGNRIGEGGFGAVYKGTLNDGQDIAVKKLSRSSAQGADEFKNEISLLARLQHRNLVQLLGYCLEGSEKILIYELVPNKSLDYFLFEPEKQQLLDWSKRSKIIGGIARALLYLHEDSRLKIIHRDLKASNILLDQNMNPKVADFGTARLFIFDQSQGNTSRIAGTFGYMAPEYAIHGLFSVKSDVFSFGVLLLEIVSGKKNSSFYQEHGGDDLLTYAWRQWRDGTPLSLLDPAIGRNSYPRNEVIQIIHIGLLCVHDDAEHRPTMASVVIMLNSCSLTLPTPNQPAYFGRTRAQSLPNELTESDNSTNDKLVPWPSTNDASITELYPR
ncbi:hypothetical protein ACH5RR_014920 [Cinchona calisaya]|uniref:Cysteine-rich receptor-like protein kinase 10 n=1 Tax=Cinchona calisaya TaxID=153742 RepID=A0ABD2ZTB9_9GENT